MRTPLLMRRSIVNQRLHPDGIVIEESWLMTEMPADVHQNLLDTSIVDADGDGDVGMSHHADRLAPVPSLSDGEDEDVSTLASDGDGDLLMEYALSGHM